MPPASENEQQQREGARGQPCWGLAKFPAASISPSRGGEASRKLYKEKKKEREEWLFAARSGPNCYATVLSLGSWLAAPSQPCWPALISANEAPEDPRGGAGTTEPNPGWGQGQLLHHFRISRGENQATNPSHLQESNSLARSAGDGAGKTELGHHRWLQHVPIKPKKQSEGYGVCYGVVPSPGAAFLLKLAAVIGIFGRQARAAAHSMAQPCSVRLLTATICPKKSLGLLNPPTPCRAVWLTPSPRGAAPSCGSITPKRGLWGGRTWVPVGTSTAGAGTLRLHPSASAWGGDTAPTAPTPVAEQTHKGRGWNNSPLEAPRRGTSAND